METLKLPLETEDRKTVSSRIFNVQLSDESIDARVADFEPFFAYHQWLVKAKESSITGTHAKICEVVELLKKSQTTYASFTAELVKEVDDRDRHNAAEIVEDALQLACRMYLMCHFEGPPAATNRGGVTINEDQVINWSTGSIGDAVKHEFKHQTTLSDHVKFEKLFNARNLRRIADIKVRWTDNLVDHLRMTDNDRVVLLFSHTSFLKLKLLECRNHAALPATALPQTASPALPQDFVEETLRTLQLLLPEFDKDVQKWYAKKCKKALKNKAKPPLDPAARMNGQLGIKERQIENFKYWHDRLIILKQVFDEAEPNDFKHWWRDRRKRVQWYTFWTAVAVFGFTIFFGLVQSIEGGMQVYLAFQAANSDSSSTH